MKNRIYTLVLLTFIPLCLIGQSSSSFSSGMQSTSSQMMQSGSQYAPQVTPPGATSPYSVATEPSNRRRAFDDMPDPNESKESPIGEPICLLAFAAAAGVAVYRRKNKA